MLENNFSKNDKIVLNIHRLLIDIIKNPELFNDKIELLHLKSQANLAKMEYEEYDIFPTSLNTLKRRSTHLFSGGFTELEELRANAHKSISYYRNPTKINKINPNDRLKQLQIENENLKRTNILMTNLFLDNLKVINGIQSIESTDIIKKQLLELSNKMRAYGLLDSNFLALTENSNVVSIKKDKK